MGRLLLSGLKIPKRGKSATEPKRRSAHPPVSKPQMPEDHRPVICSTSARNRNDAWDALLHVTCCPELSQAALAGLQAVGESAAGEVQPSALQGTVLVPATAMVVEPPGDPYCLVPLSCFEYAPYVNGSKRIVGYQVVEAHWGSTRWVVQQSFMRNYLPSRNLSRTLLIINMAVLCELHQGPSDPWPYYKHLGIYVYMYILLCLCTYISLLI